MYLRNAEINAALWVVRNCALLLGIIQAAKGVTHERILSRCGRFTMDSQGALRIFCFELTSMPLDMESDEYAPSAAISRLISNS
jgi:hypothetical protein